MFESKVLSTDNPSPLLNMAWFYLEYHFCRRGREGLRSLKKSSFNFGIDDTNNAYVFLNFNEAPKNHPGDLQDDFQSRKRMYATDDEKCPVKAIKKYLQKLNPNCEHFFQRPKVYVAESDQVGYNNQPLGVNTLGKMMVKISEKAKLSQKYTNHCVRATTITTLSNAGIETLVIMAMSGHRNESSIKVTAKMHLIHRNDPVQKSCKMPSEVAVVKKTRRMKMEMKMKILRKSIL
ncbi:uncharacterized protein [Apostichopus japonicus]|uniref:uncharacterized protein isoform X1 n=1 Tax=Stichopus japonicus TaxID=307972 RepID=UPI003AB39F7F